MLFSEFSKYPKYEILSLACLREPSIMPNWSIFIFVPIGIDAEFIISNWSIFDLLFELFWLSSFGCEINWYEGSIIIMLSSSLSFSFWLFVCRITLFEFSEELLWFDIYSISPISFLLQH